MSEKYIEINSNFYIQSGFAFPSTAFVESGIPIVRMSDLKSGKLRFENTKYVNTNWLKIAHLLTLKENDFLIGMSGSLSNYATVNSSDIPALLNQRVGRLVSKNPIHNYTYVTYWLKSNFYHRYAEIQGEGAAQKNISAKQIGAFRYRNIDIKEQDQIVRILSAIDEAIEKTEVLIEKYQQVKIGLMQDLFTRGIGADGKLRPTLKQAPDLYNETKIGWIPKSWVLIGIENVANVVDPNPSHRNPIYHEEGFPFISTVEFKEGDEVEVDTPRRVIEEIVLEQERRCKFSATSIAFSRKGTIAEIRFLPSHLRFALLDSLCVINPININPDYLFHSLRSECLKRQTKNMTMGQALPQISIGRVRDLKIPMPKDQSEQIAIADRLNSVSRYIFNNHKMLNKLKEQKAGLMDDLLAGNKAVMVDEPEANMSEYTEVEQPFLQQLAELGWISIDQGEGIPQNPLLSLRQGFRQWLLPDVFTKAVATINTTSKGKPWLTDKQLQNLQDNISRQPNRTLLEANEAIQKLLFKSQVDLDEITGEQDPIVKLIDFINPENNVFHAINQFRIDTPGCIKQFIIPDIVLFINGIPLIVVECKKGGPTCANPMAEAFEQLQRYMNKRKATQEHGLKEGEPRLFHTSMMLIRSSGVEADYGTITSGEEHFYPWKTQWPQKDDITEGWNQQQQLINGMLNKTNLLNMLRTCSVFMDTDSGPRIKVVCRYQQFRAANKIIGRLRDGKTVQDKSGVVWHTQGSGKSLTMVFVARMLRVSRDLNDYKILLINDRVDLEDQLATTATIIGGRVNTIESRKGLREHLSTDSSDINMVMVHKFQLRDETLPNTVAEALGTYQAMPTKQTFGVVNNSSRIVLMIDEAHRTQGSDLGDNIFEAFPNAARIAFTGTPLITERHGAKKTHKRFGTYIDEYKLMDAVKDGTTLQILYEGRTSDDALNDKHGFETSFENLFKGRSDEEILAIKKKYGATGDIQEAENRINAIGKDIVKHYLEHIYPNEFKAQVVCFSKLAAVRYQTAIHSALREYVEALKAEAHPDLAQIKRVEFLKAAVVISGDGTNEAAYITKARKQAKEWSAVDNFCRSFDLDDPDKVHSGIAFLIVCDMLLTGFDAPIEQVMYIDKKLSEHTLLQAIARTNRVKKGKNRGYVIDYIGLTENLTDALTLYAAADEQQELANGFKSIASEMPVLEERYQRILQLFAQHKILQVREFVEGELPNIQADATVVHEAVKLLKDEKIRADFDVYLKKFLMSLDIILPHQAAHKYRIPAKRLGYILRVTKERYKDTSLNLGDAGAKVKDLINEHLVNLGINPKVDPVELLSEHFIENLNKNAGGNEEAKASEMEHAIRKHCTVHHDEDPAFYKSLSEKVEKLITQYQDQWEKLAEELDKLRTEAKEGRKQGEEGMSKEATTFYEHIASQAFEGGNVPTESKAKMKVLMEAIVETLQASIGSIDFWNNPNKQKRTRSEIKTALTLTGIHELKQNRERVAIEIMKLAKNRHDALVQHNNEGVN